jgi:hypothetical protein
LLAPRPLSAAFAAHGERSAVEGLRVAAPSLGAMHTTTFIAGLALAFMILVTPLCAEAQPAGKIARIGFLGGRCQVG